MRERGRSGSGTAGVRAVALAGLGAGAALALLPGCAGEQTKASDLALAALQARLPGRYDNSAQAREAVAGQEPGAASAVELLIVPANAALIARATYYVRETVAGQPHLVLSQYIWVFGRALDSEGKASADAGSKDKVQHLEQHVYRFREPKRWTQVAEQPELLESLLPEDLERLSGCDLLWTWKDKSFTAQRESANCAPQFKVQGDLLVERVELRDNHLALLEQRIGPEGLTEVPAAAADPYYRFVRRGGAN